MAYRRTLGLIPIMNNFHVLLQLHRDMRVGICLNRYNFVALGLGFTKKPNMRLSPKSLCDSLDSQKTSKRRAAFSETTSPPKKSKPGKIKTYSALETLGKNGQVQPFCAQGNMTLRARGPAVMTTKLGAESALSPVRNGLRSSVVPSESLTPQYTGR